MNNPPIIAITGGIGSGKSVVSKLLRVMGYQVYDCDERARWVMTHDALLRQQLVALFGPDTYCTTTGGDDAPTTTDDAERWVLNKPYLSAQIFGHPEALAQMNACVHPAVARDLMCQYEAMTDGNVQSERIEANTTKPFFFESAILFESGFDKLVPPTDVWMVSAPLELRIERAMLRDHASREQVLERIGAQMSQEEKECRSDYIIYNDAEHSLIAQVNHLLLCLQKKNANRS